jgi:hypothetical protein
MCEWCILHNGKIRLRSSVSESDAMTAAPVHNQVPNEKRQPDVFFSF